MAARDLLQYWPMVEQYAPYVSAGLAGVVGTGVLARSLLRRGTGTRQHEAAWASWRDVRKAYLLGKQGIVVGHVGGQVLRYHGRGHVFVDAATQSGKSRSLVVPTLLEAQPRTSLLVHDPKGDLYEETARYRATVSRVLRIAPASPQTDHCNPLDAIRVGTVHETADVDLWAAMMVNPDDKILENEGSVHYVDMVRIVVKGLGMYGLHTGAYTSLGELYVIVTQGQLKATVDAMQHVPHPAVRQAYELLSVMDDKQFSGVTTTLMRLFDLYGDPLIGEMVSYSDFALSDIRQGKELVTIYLSVPFRHLARTKPLIQLLLKQWLDYATDVPRTWRKQGWHRLLVMGEEFPSLKRLNLAKDIMNQGAGLGVQLCLITPSMNDIEEIWGTHHNFLDNSHVQVYFGISDEKIAERISKRLGTHTVRKARKTVSAGKVSWTYEDVQEPLMSSSQITHMDPQQVLVIARDKQVIVEQTPWDQWEPWKSRGVAA